MKNTKIEWATHTFNPWIGCQKVSPACDNCYAEDWAKRYGRDFATPTRTSSANWREPLKWNRDANVADQKPRVFCASLADVFDNRVPTEWRDDLFALIRSTQNLDWLIVTKRISNVTRMLPADWGIGWPNVWIIATVANQKEADRDIPRLLEIPAIVRGLSIEPMLGEIDLYKAGAFTGGPCAGGGDSPIEYDNWGLIDWVIVGGESGPHARPMHPKWLRSIRDQCISSGVPFFFKQWGEWIGAEHYDLAVDKVECRRFDDGTLVERVGKKLAGRTLDGRAWDKFPDVGRSSQTNHSSEQDLKAKIEALEAEIKRLRLALYAISKSPGGGQIKRIACQALGEQQSFC